MNIIANPDLSHVRKGYVPTRRGEIHYRQCGEGNVTIVFLHAVSTGGLGFNDVLPCLARSGFRSYAIDLMGYGRSDKRDPGSWRIHDFVENTQEAFERLQVVPTCLVAGHFSGIVALEMAAQSETEVRKLVLDGVPVVAPDRRQLFRDGQSPTTSVEWHEDGRHALSYWKTCFNLLSKVDPTLKLSANPPQALRENYIALLETFLFEPNTMDAVATYEIEQRCHDIKCPTLLVSSDCDWNRPHIETLAAHIPNNKVRIFEGTHPLHQILAPHRSQEYADLICDFLNTQFV